MVLHIARNNARHKILSGVVRVDGDAVKNFQFIYVYSSRLVVLNISSKLIEETHVLNVEFEEDDNDSSLHEMTFERLIKAAADILNFTIEEIL